ncbi:hypothetical protein EAO28_13905 [Klebsiella pneumoniae]|uniref:Uncharacterized protein n=1 Tax=Klebsiella pneumoniae TaxID=573 RepID=A0A3P2EGS7_KLEPN|nr:hypothetical protein EAO28_13905 [Klebsiella pneumoniae]
MSSRLKQTTIDVGNFAALMSPRPAGGRGSVAPVSAAPPGEIYPHSKKTRTFRDGVLFKRKKKARSFDRAFCFI